MVSAKNTHPKLGYLTRKDTKVKLLLPTRVKNKNPAPIQITAEQTLREARELQKAVYHLPRVDQLWYKYIHMKEMLGNVAGSSKVFERWMQWMPDQQCWRAYINFELRYDEIERGRQLFERFVQSHPKVGVKEKSQTNRESRD